MNRQFCLTKDGSYTLFVPELKEHYHSVNGAVDESLHVYIQAGLFPLLARLSNIQILEIGWGTALNTVLSEVFTRGDKEVFYTAIEAYPLQEEEVRYLNYVEIYSAISSEILLKMHDLPWNSDFQEVRKGFYIKKCHTLLENYTFEQNVFDLVYFDAFAPDVQPAMWDKKIFINIFKSMKKGGILCTYCAKGIIRRQLKEIGFVVERLPGACGKREMLRAVKE